MEEEQLIEEVDKEAGSYVLILYNEVEEEIKIGKLDSIDLKEGYYIYVGSALGPGGVQARVKRHNQEHKKSHWHIDYLRAKTDLAAVWYLYSTERFEHQLAQLFAERSTVPLAGFGSSDCNCQAHLFYSGEEPKFSYYEEELEEVNLYKV